MAWAIWPLTEKIRCSPILQTTMGAYQSRNGMVGTSSVVRGSAFEPPLSSVTVEEALSTYRAFYGIRHVVWSDISLRDVMH
jgi:hypothetical protein